MTKKLSILDEIAQVTVDSRKGPLCSVARILSEMPEVDAADLDTAFADRLKYSNKAIFTVLRARGFDICQTTIARHRRGECACGAPR